jgi:sugar phosphate isomerase/epimerase
MSSRISRRSFLNRCVHAGTAAAAITTLQQGRILGIEPIKRAGSPRFLLSLAAYSFRESLDEPGRRQAQPPAKTGKRINLFDFIDYCADHGCQGAELTSYYFPATVDNDYLIKIKRHAFLRGVAISGTAVGNTFTVPKSEAEKRAREIATTKKWIDHAAIIGAPHIRVFAGTAGNLSEVDAKRLCIEALEECGAYAAAKGVFLGIENHGGIVAEPDALIDIVRTVKNPWIGINLDTGNFRTADPYADLAKCAPYAVNVQFKVEMQPRGQQKQRADLSRILEVLRQANYQGYVALEYEAAEDPWKAVPPLLEEMSRALKA